MNRTILVATTLCLREWTSSETLARVNFYTPCYDSFNRALDDIERSLKNTLVVMNTAMMIPSAVLKEFAYAYARTYILYHYYDVHTSLNVSIPGLSPSKLRAVATAPVPKWLIDLVREFARPMRSKSGYVFLPHIDSFIVDTLNDKAILSPLNHDTHLRAAVATSMPQLMSTVGDALPITTPFGIYWRPGVTQFLSVAMRGMTFDSLPKTEVLDVAPLTVTVSNRRLTFAAVEADDYRQHTVVDYIADLFMEPMRREFVKMYPVIFIHFNHSQPTSNELAEFTKCGLSHYEARSILLSRRVTPTLMTMFTPASPLFLPPVTCQYPVNHGLLFLEEITRGMTPVTGPDTNHYAHALVFSANFSAEWSRFAFPSLGSTEEVKICEYTLPSLGKTTVPSNRKKKSNRFGKTKDKPGQLNEIIVDQKDVNTSTALKPMYNSESKK